METTKIPLAACVESSYQNRKELGDVSGLARSIEVNGQITPLIVVGDGESYQLVAGHRRTAAMRSLGIEEADAYVMDGWDDARIAQILNAENNHRRELTEAERGRGIQTMLSLGVPVSDAAVSADIPEDRADLKAMIVPTGDMPYRKTLQADENGSFLRALQECVGGRIEPMGWVFGDKPTVYCNEEGLLPGSGCAPNRAIYADAAMAEAGYASQDDPSRPVEPGELYHIAYGDMVCVGFDPETGEDRDITPEECQRVMERFGSVESIASGPIETCGLLARAGRVVRL